MGGVETATLVGTPQVCICTLVGILLVSGLLYCPCLLSAFCFLLQENDKTIMMLFVLCMPAVYLCSCMAAMQI